MSLDSSDMDEKEKQLNLISKDSDFRCLLVYDHDFPNDEASDDKKGSKKSGLRSKY